MSPTPYQIAALAGLDAFDRALAADGKRLEETAYAMLVYLISQATLPALGVHRSYAALGEAVGSRSGNGMALSKTAVADAVHELDRLGLLERERDHPITHARDGEGSIHLFRPVELTDVDRPVSASAAAAIFSHVPRQAKVGPVAFSVFCRLALAADGSLALRDLTRNELADVAGVDRKTAFKALAQLQAAGVGVRSFSRTGKRLNGETRRPVDVFSVELFAANAPTSAPNDPEPEVIAGAIAGASDEGVLEIAEKKLRKPRPRTPRETVQEGQAITDSWPKELRVLATTARTMIEARMEPTEKNGVEARSHLTPSQILNSIVRPIDDLYKQYGGIAPDFVYECVKGTSKSYKGPHRGFRNYLNGCASDANRRWRFGIDKTRPRTNADLDRDLSGETAGKEVRALLQRAASLNNTNQPDAARELLPEILGHAEALKPLFADELELAEASLREAFKQGIDDFAGINPDEYGFDYLPEWQWPATLPTAAQRERARYEETLARQRAEDDALV